MRKCHATRSSIGTQNTLPTPPPRRFQPPSNRLLPTPHTPPAVGSRGFRPCAGGYGYENPSRETLPSLATFNNQKSPGNPRPHENQRGEKIGDAARGWQGTENRAADLGARGPVRASLVRLSPWRHSASAGPE